MAEFIDREKINEIAFTDAVLVKGEVKTERIALLREIDEIPTADVEQVTRCRDCRKFKTYGCRMVASGYDDFCSYGERKDDAT